MFASQTRDLYHIETDRKGGYIEFAARQIYRAEQGEAYRQKASVDTEAVLVKKKDGEGFCSLSSFLLQIASKCLKIGTFSKVNKELTKV